MKLERQLAAVVHTATSKAMWMDFYKAAQKVRDREPKFPVGAIIQSRVGDLWTCEVVEGPDTYLHNFQPSYLLRPVSEVGKLPTINRAQAEIDVTWHSAACMFKRGDKIRHVKSKTDYWVVATPDVARLEETNEPAYVYRSDFNNLWWTRRQSEMEDGRFVVVPGF
jgi:hypothetical protein